MILSPSLFMHISLYIHRCSLMSSNLFHGYPESVTAKHITERIPAEPKAATVTEKKCLAKPESVTAIG